jgi:hypothetical protein
MEQFDPIVRSDQECAYLLAHLEESPAVALVGVQKASVQKINAAQQLENVDVWIGVPDGVNPTVIRKDLGRFRELAELEDVKGLEWCGYDALRDRLEWYLGKYIPTRDRMRQAGMIPNPSMFHFDSEGNAYRGADGTDSGRVRTWIDENGERHPFALDLVHRDGRIRKEHWTVPSPDSFVPKGSIKEPEIDTAPLPVVDLELFEDAAKGNLECGVCGYVSNYKPGNRRSRNMAKINMRKHCGGAKAEVAAHRKLQKELNSFE